MANIYYLSLLYICMYNPIHHYFECAVELVTCRSTISRIQQKEYVTAMKTAKQRNMAHRELKLAIGDELQTLFHPIIQATKQAAKETRKRARSNEEYLDGYRWSFESSAC